MIKVYLGNMIFFIVLDCHPMLNVKKLNLNEYLVDMLQRPVGYETIATEQINACNRFYFEPILTR